MPLKIASVRIQKMSANKMKRSHVVNLHTATTSGILLKSKLNIQQHMLTL